MKFFTLLQAENNTSEALNQKAEGTTVEVKDNPSGSDVPTEEVAATGGGSGWMMWVMLGLIFVVMYFFMIRPQKKQQKELQKFRDAIKKGDKVVTIGGIYGTVSEVKDNTVLMEVDNSVKIRVSKQALIKDFSDPMN